MSQLLQDGYPLVTQLSASGDLVARNPFLSVQCGNLTVAELERLLQEYKSLALGHEVLLDGVKQQDTPSVLSFISEFETKLHWRSIWPSEGHLLVKYPFLCSSFQNLSFRDIARLLNSYKVLVLETEALVCGIKRRIIPESVTNGQIQASLDFPSLEEYQAQQFRFPQELNEAPPLITSLSRPRTRSATNEAEEESPQLVKSLSGVSTFTRNPGLNSHPQFSVISDGNPPKQSEDLIDLSDDVVLVGTPHSMAKDSETEFGHQSFSEKEGTGKVEPHREIGLEFEILDEEKQKVQIKLTLADE